LHAEKTERNDGTVADCLNRGGCALNHAGKYLIPFLVLFAACDRPIPVVESPVVNGYEVQGTVTDQIGNPVPNVKVLLDYTEDLDFTDSAATRKYFVTDESKPVQAVVVNWDNQVIRALTPPQNFYGWYQVLWDGTDSSGTLTPSGIYYIQYLVGGIDRFTYSQLVSGGQVATTDSTGQYTIPMQYLPVDSSSVPYFSSYDSTYAGNLVISNDIVLTYKYSTQVQQIQRTIDKGQVTIINVIFH